MSYIFISYARKDRGFVDDVARDLKKRGIRCWVDRHDIPGGATWRALISKAITNCTAFLIVLSPDSAASDNVKRELALAESHHRKILPIRYKTSRIPPEMELTLTSVQMIDFEEPTYEDAFHQLIEALQLLFNNPDAPLHDLRPKLVYWISCLYLLWGGYLFLAYALFLLGIDGQTSEITRYFGSHSRLELALTIMIAAVNIPTAIVLFCMKTQAVQLVLVSWVLNTIDAGFTLWSHSDSQPWLETIAIYSVVSYVFYYTYGLKQDGKLTNYGPPAVLDRSTNAGAISS